MTLPDRPVGDNSVAPKPESERKPPVVRAIAMGAVKGALSFVPGGGIVAEAINVMEGRAAQKQQLATAMAIEALGKDVDWLKSKLTDDEELADLWLIGLNAARTAQMEEKLRLFASILAGAVDADHQQRLVANTLMRILEQLEREHIEVMVVIEQAGVESEAAEVDESVGSAGATLESLESRLPHLIAVMPVLTADLTRLSLIYNTLATTWAGIEGGAAFAPTKLGGELLKVLRAAS
jgi:hypothetical protein